MLKDKKNKLAVCEELIECQQSLQKAILVLRDIAFQNFEFNPVLYDEIWKTLEIVKNCAASRGLLEEAEFVHNCQAIFWSCRLDKKFCPDAIQLTSIFLEQLSDFFSGHEEVFFKMQATNKQMTNMLK